MSLLSILDSVNYEVVGLMGFVAHHFKVADNMKKRGSLPATFKGYVKKRWIKFLLSMIFTFVAFLMLVSIGPKYDHLINWSVFWVPYLFFGTFMSEMLIDKLGTALTKYTQTHLDKLP